MEERAPSDPTRVRGEIDRLFDLSQDLMCVAGTDGYFKRINPAFEQLLGYDREELLSRQFVEFVHPDDVEGTVREVQNLAEGRMVVDFQNRYRAKDGSWKWLAWRATPGPDRELVYAVARDITAVKRNEAQMARQAAELARSNADLEQFAYVASHDLVAPLRAVRSLLGFIEEDLPDDLPAKVREHFEKIQTRIGRLERLTQDLLRYSRARDANSNLETVDVAEMVRDLASLLPVAPGFRVDYVGEVRRFETASIALEQVLRNLIGNALKHHGGEKGRVEVSVHDAGDRWEFRVADDGRGVPADARTEIFERFHRLGSEETVGFGLGLALIRQIVEGYGGRIWVEDAVLGGADFRFTWPKRIGGEHADDPDR